MRLMGLGSDAHLCHAAAVGMAVGPYTAGPSSFTPSFRECQLVLIINH